MKDGKVISKCCIFTVALAFGLLIWALDSTFDYFFFNREGASEAEILNLSLRTTYISHLFLLPLFFILGILMMTAFARRKKAEDNLEKEKTFTTTVLNTVTDVFYVFDAEGKMLRWNSSLNAVTGYTNEEISSMRAPDFFSGEDVKRAAETIQKVWKEGKAEVFLDLVTKDKRKIPYCFSGSLLKDDCGNPLFVCGFGKDVTLHKKEEEMLQHERNKLIGILDSMADGAYIVDQKYNIQYMNPVVEKEFGSINERKCYEYFHDRTGVCPWCKNQDVFKGKTVSWEWCSSKTNKTYDLLDTPFINPDGSISKLEFFHDITEHKKSAEEKMEVLSALGKRAKELNCLYGLSKLVGRSDILLDGIFQGAVDLIPPRMAIS